MQEPNSVSHKMELFIFFEPIFYIKSSIINGIANLAVNHLNKKVNPVVRIVLNVTTICLNNYFICLFSYNDFIFFIFR